MLYRERLREAKEPGYYVSIVVEDEFEHQTFTAETWHFATVAEVEAFLAEHETYEQQQALIKSLNCLGSGVFSLEHWTIIERCEDGREFVCNEREEARIPPHYDYVKMPPVETGVSPGV